MQCGNKGTPAHGVSSPETLFQGSQRSEFVKGGEKNLGISNAALLHGSVHVIKQQVDIGTCFPASAASWQGCSLQAHSLAHVQSVGRLCNPQW